jgi:hypothetical protein
MRYFKNLLLMLAVAAFAVPAAFAGGSTHSVGTPVNAVGAAGAIAGPTPVTLTFDGTHVANSSLPDGLRHEGHFTAAPPLCAHGTAVDVEDLEGAPLSVMRKYTCDDGSGTFTAFLPAVAAEHGGNGAWKIVAGTERYATLRGQGTYTGHLVSGNRDDFPSVVYQTTWQGVVDFDAVAPSVTANARAKKLRRPARTYAVPTVIDAHEPGFTYSVDIRAGKRYLALKTGTSSSSAITVSARIQAPRGTRAIIVLVTVTDAVGNESSTTLVVKLKPAAT